MAADPRSDPGTRCSRAREWCSLRLDGELSEVESRLLERHLGTCEACRAFDASTRGSTELIRSAPLLEPTRPFRLRPEREVVDFPARRRVVAALVAAALALGSLLGSLHSSPPAPAPAPELSLLTPDVAELRGIPRDSGAPAPAVVNEPPGAPTGAV